MSQDSKKTVPSISSQQAWEMLQKESSALLIDVRSSMEFLFVGHPTGAIHVPWIDEPDWQINKNFATEVRKLLLYERAIILICRSGKRSLEAGNFLLENGFKNIYNISDGFEGELNEKHQRSSLGGWRFYGLPWEQC